MGVEKGTRLILAQHQAEGIRSPLLGAEARAHIPGDEGIIHAVIDESFPEPAQTPVVVEAPTPTTLRDRVSVKLHNLGQTLLEKIA